MLENLTEFDAVCIPSLDLHDRERAVLIVAGRFDIPPPGAVARAALPHSETQRPVPLADEYIATAGSSSLWWEGQSVFARPGTDIYVHGHACSQGERPAAIVDVAVQVGPCRRVARVFGDRVWRRGLGQPRASAPAPFRRMPLVYERCFGGSVEGRSGRAAAVAAHNPIGCGLVRGRESFGRPLPNIENPRHPITSANDRPLPHGFGPLGRGWLPRRHFAGTYSRTWMETRAPLWPSDLDARYFMAAPRELQAIPHLRGGEPVVLIGLHPRGPIRFCLPRPRLVAKFGYANGGQRRPLVLDAVMVEPDDLRVTMIWRASALGSADTLSRGGILVRSLESWEQDAA